MSPLLKKIRLLPSSLLVKVLLEIVAVVYGGAGKRFLALCYLHSSLNLLVRPRRGDGKDHARTTSFLPSHTLF